MAHFNEIRTGRWKARLMDVRSKWTEQKINKLDSSIAYFWLHVDEWHYQCHIIKYHCNKHGKQRLLALN